MDYTAADLSHDLKRIKREGFDLKKITLFNVMQDGKIRFRLTSSHHRKNGLAIDFTCDETTIFHAKDSREGDYHDTDHPEHEGIIK